jgi:hypothetical protein
MTTDVRLTAERRTELVTRWRERADQLDIHARRCRSDGDVPQAEDTEASAVEYRIAADDLEPRGADRSTGCSTPPLEATVGCSSGMAL